MLFGDQYAPYECLTLTNHTGWKLEAFNRKLEGRDFIVVLINNRL